MRYLKNTYTFEIRIKKSLFIAIVQPIVASDDAKILIDEIKIKHPKANHYCSASLFGDSAQHATANDDGEPSRTAGIPMLEVLKHHSITNVLCVVVRYFGGIKLGSGGLVRAYRQSVASVMKLADFYLKTSALSYKLSFQYSNIDQIDQYLKDKASVIEKIFLETVTYSIISNPENSFLLTEIKHLLTHHKELKEQTLWIKDIHN